MERGYTLLKDLHDIEVVHLLILLVNFVIDLKHLTLVPRIKDPRKATDGEVSFETLEGFSPGSASFPAPNPLNEVILEINLLINCIIVELLVVNSLLQRLLVVCLIKDIQEADSILNYFGLNHVHGDGESEVALDVLNELKHSLFCDCVLQEVLEEWGSRPELVK